MHKSNKLLPDSYTSAALTYYHSTISKNKDSIEAYLKVTKKILQSEPNKVFERSIYESQLGDYFFSKNDFTNAIKQYEKAILLAKESSALKIVLHSYQKLSASYENLSDGKRSMMYLKKYTALSDSLNSPINTNFEISLTRILDEKKIKSSNEKNEIVLFFGILIIVFGIFAVRNYLRNKDKNSLKEKLLEDNKKIIKEKEETLSVNEELIQVLEKKVNEKFNELIQLAKANAPNFYVRFHEVYPSFQEALLGCNKKLTASDLTFYAYLYLDFQTKEIADFTFKSIKTIQNKKSSLRKKVNISSSEDLYVWIKNVTKSYVLF